MNVAARVLSGVVSGVLSGVFPGALPGSYPSALAARSLPVFAVPFANAPLRVLPVIHGHAIARGAALRLAVEALAGGAGTRLAALHGVVVDSVGGK